MTAGHRLAGRVFVYAILLAAGAFQLAPFLVMAITSLKTLEEIRTGNLLSLPVHWTLEPWQVAWDSACVGINCIGLKSYFWNSVRLTVPAVALSTLIGALNGYVLAQWRFRGNEILFGLIVFGCFIPFQIVLIPLARVLGLLGIAGTVQGLIFAHTIYGIAFTTLFFRNYYVAFPAEIIRAARVDGAGFLAIFRRVVLPASLPIIMVSVIWQFTNIWNDYIFGVSFAGNGESMPIMVALNNIVNTSSTGIKQYNVHMAAAFISALPTLVIYFFAGRYFVSGLMAGAVKG